MPRLPRRISGTSSQATNGVIGPDDVSDVLALTGEDCEGYGDETGSAGGYGIEETGYGDPCVIEGWFLRSFLEESLPNSEISGITPSSGEQTAREDGGELAVLSSSGDLSEGPYQIFIRPTGGTIERPAYSGVLGQGNDIIPNIEAGLVTFVTPPAVQLGAADVIIRRPEGDVELVSFFEYVPSSERDTVRLLSSFFPPQYARAQYQPTIED